MLGLPLTINRFYLCCFYLKHWNFFQQGSGCKALKILVFAVSYHWPYPMCLHIEYTPCISVNKVTLYKTLDRSLENTSSNGFVGFAFLFFQDKYWKSIPCGCCIWQWCGHNFIQTWWHSELCGPKALVEPREDHGYRPTRRWLVQTPAFWQNCIHCAQILRPWMWKIVNRRSDFSKILPDFKIILKMVLLTLLKQLMCVLWKRAVSMGEGWGLS